MNMAASTVPPVIAESTQDPSDLPEPPLKKTCTESRSRAVSDASSSEKKTPAATKCRTKRPQLRYEPNVPMTKEQAAVWRREQRRKRNRESAAASRQRQRDRIAELEEEVDGWKERFNAAMDRLSKLEALHGVSQELTPDVIASADSTPVSPSPSPDLMTKADASPASRGQSSEETELTMSLDTMPTTNGNEQHLNEKISRPA